MVAPAFAPERAAELRNQLSAYVMTLAALRAYVVAAGQLPCPVQFDGLGDFPGTERCRAAIGTWLGCFAATHTTVTAALGADSDGEIRQAVSLAHHAWGRLTARLAVLASRNL